ncbi:MAG: DUF4956 domain-containing protein [Clostridiales bacterium]|nr:DUF4956 domain-containing protein [Clostridiales bacterium]MDD6872614.1 DUF4956 domain-containing protein [Clostridiales bacterium]MDD7367399.1 DUF4956 domain-containing protein [Clostridiales bacterium]MDY2872206.1 DUF4956 domain-containing protein [Eubacteriales bacterium]
MPTLLTATGTSYNKSTLAALFANQTISTGSWLTIVFSLALAFATGLFIYWIYRSNYRGVMYNNNFGLTLVLMTLITTPVVMCIRESIQLSMGMVGALSIVRFRTAVKDPLDTAYMFWALTMGILLGAGQFFFAALTVVGIGALIIVMNRLKFKQMNSYLLVVHYVPGLESQINAALKGVRVSQVKSKTVSRNGAEMTIELRVEKQDALVNRLLAIEGVQDATLVAYQPE